MSERTRVRSAQRAASAWRIVLGSMNRTSSETTWNSSTSWTPRSRKKATSRSTSSSGAVEEGGGPLAQFPRRAGAGRDADDALSLQPLVGDLLLVVDQLRVGAL